MEKKLYLLITLLMAVGYIAVGQNQTGVPDSLSLDVRFGPYRDKGNAIAEDFRKLVNAELIVTDSSSTKWKIVQYRVGWRRKEQSVDIKTGVSKTIFTYTAENVQDSTRLPVFWQEQLKQQLQSGETILFEDIIVLHSKAGRIRKARPISIKIM